MALTPCGDSYRKESWKGKDQRETVGRSPGHITFGGLSRCLFGRGFLWRILAFGGLFGRCNTEDDTSV